MPGTRNLFEVDNARYLSPQEIAATFVPTVSFRRLFSEKNHIVLGARGSGKTALAKMLSHDHLRLFDDAETREIVLERAFIGIYVPMRLEWVSALKNKPWQTEAETEEFFQWRLNVAAVLAFLRTAKSCLDHYFPSIPDRANNEEKFVRRVASIWFTNVDFLSDGISISTLESEIRRIEYVRQRNLVEARARGCALNDLATGSTGDEFSVELLAPIHVAVPILGEIIGMPAHGKWIVALDEAEFLDPMHQRVLNSLLRSASGDLIFKITTMPYCHYTLETNTRAELIHGQDFEYIYIDSDLTVDVDDDAPGSGGQPHGMAFARKIVERRADYSKLNLQPGFLEAMLGPTEVLDAGSRSIYLNRTSITAIWPHVDIKTSERANRFLKWFEEAEDAKAKTRVSSHFASSIGRKLKPAILIREKVGQLRGATKSDIYSGSTMVIRCGDGNPRRIVQIFNRLFAAARWAGRKPRGKLIPRQVQDQILVQISGSQLTSIRAKGEFGPATHAFLINLGEEFARLLHQRRISTDQYGSVEFSDAQFREYEGIIKTAVGRGLLYPRYRDEPRDQLPHGRSVFRLAYILAPHFRLLPRKGRTINVAQIGRRQLTLELPSEASENTSR